MNRIVATCLALTVILAAGCAETESPPSEGGDGVSKIVLISIDTLRADYLTPYDPSKATSPNLDALARNGVLFTDAVSQAGSTTPSHHSLFSGLYPWIRGALVSRKVATETVPPPLSALQDAGLKTVGLVGGGRIAARFGFGSGFDEYVDLAAVAEEQGRAGPERLNLLEERSVEWLEDHRDEDFFLFLHTYQVHCPYDPPAEIAARFTDAYAGAFNCKQARGSDIDFDYVRALYAAEVAYVDAFFGRLIEALERLGIADETMIIVTSDHGEMLGEDGSLGHSTVDNLVLSVPLIIRAPGIEPARIEDPVALIDVMPTVLSAVGVEPPYRLQGVDLFPVMRGETRIDPGRTRFASAQNLSVAVYRGRYKAEIKLETGIKRLYDVEADPTEQRDLAAEQPGIVEELHEAFDRMIEENRDLASLFEERSEEIDVDERLEQRLRALGYVE